MKFAQRNFLRLLPLIGGLLLMPFGRMWADHPPDTIFKTLGFVRDTQGNPVVGVDVTGDNYIGDFYPSTTDTNGAYEVLFPSDGNYRIQVNCSQLTALGYSCVAPFVLTQEADPIEHNFIVETAVVSLKITNVSLPKGNVSAAYNVQLGATDGMPPYLWQMASNSPNLPTGLSLNSGGLISGIPTTNSAFAFRVQVTDSTFAVTNKILSITVNRRPVLLTPNWHTNRFSMRLFGAAEQNYTIQMSTNPSSTNWISLFSTNNLNSSSYIVSDTNASSQGRFYRVLIGP